eukprot:gene6516-23915_t
MASAANGGGGGGAQPAMASEAVLVESQDMPEGSVEGEAPDIHALLQSYATTGFQATNFGLAVNEINRMRKWRLSDVPVAADEDEAFLDPKVRAETKCKIFFGYTSNLISAGTRESIKFLAQNKM